MNNDISVISSYKNKSGDLMGVSDSKGTRDELKNLVTTPPEDIIMKNSTSQVISTATVCRITKRITKRGSNQ